MVKLAVASRRPASTSPPTRPLSTELVLLTCDPVEQQCPHEVLRREGHAVLVPRPQYPQCGVVQPQAEQEGEEEHLEEEQQAHLWRREGKGPVEEKAVEQGDRGSHFLEVEREAE